MYTFTYRENFAFFLCMLALSVSPMSGVIFSVNPAKVYTMTNDCIYENVFSKQNIIKKKSK